MRQTLRRTVRIQIKDSKEKRNVLTGKVVELSEASVTVSLDKKLLIFGAQLTDIA